MDAKGRLAVPTRHREVLQPLCGGALTVTRSPEGCLIIFPRPTWEAFRDRIAAWPMSATAWKRIYLGNAMDVEMDSAGRILISPELRAAAKLDKQVSLVGMGSHFELWDATTNDAQQDDLKGVPMPDEIKGFSF